MFVDLNMSDNLKEWMLYADIILLSAWFGYGGKTIYNGGTLGFGYLVFGFLIIPLNSVPFLLNYIVSFITWYRMEKYKTWTFVLPLLNVYPIFGNK